MCTTTISLDGAQTVYEMVEHMPRIVDFWSTLVFDTRRYTANAFRPHLAMQGTGAGPSAPAARTRSRHRPPSPERGT